MKLFPVAATLAVFNLLVLTSFGAPELTSQTFGDLKIDLPAPAVATTSTPQRKVWRAAASTTFADGTTSATQTVFVVENDLSARPMPEAGMLALHESNLRQRAGLNRVLVRRGSFGMGPGRAVAFHGSCRLNDPHKSARLIDTAAWVSGSKLYEVMWVSVVGYHVGAMPALRAATIAGTPATGFPEEPEGEYAMKETPFTITAPYLAGAEADDKGGAVAEGYEFSGDFERADRQGFRVRVYAAKLKAGDARSNEELFRLFVTYTGSTLGDAAFKIENGRADVTRNYVDEFEQAVIDRHIFVRKGEWIGCLTVSAAKRFAATEEMARVTLK